MRPKKIDKQIVCLLAKLPYIFRMSFGPNCRCFSTRQNQINYCCRWQTKHAVNDMVAISATRYEIDFMIILESYCDKTNFPGNSFEIAKSFMIKNVAIFATVITTFLMFVPASDSHGIYN